MSLHLVLFFKIAAKQEALGEGEGLRVLVWTGATKGWRWQASGVDVYGDASKLMAEAAVAAAVAQ